jgi:hypothetical protein
MTENLNKYLEKIIVNIIGCKKDKDDIKCELLEHMENLYSDFLSDGYSPERAEQLVANSMGDPQKIARSFSKISFKKAQKKITKGATKGAVGLIAAYVLFISINGLVTYRRDYEKYENFLKGIEDGRVSVVDTMTDSLYSPDYKKNALLTRAIESYDEVSKKNGFKKMLVATNAIGILEDAK